jgi:hypothetical protein
MLPEVDADTSKDVAVLTIYITVNIFVLLLVWIIEINKL